MLGFSLSPGGLLLPYHAGVLEALQYNGYLNENTPIAGSSAGAIAVVAHSCGIDSRRVLDATIRVSDSCKTNGGARGNLLQPLRCELEDFIDDDAFDRLGQRQGATGVAYRQVFPSDKAILQTFFETRHELMQAVCHSATFPFFTTNWPCALDATGDGILPRLLVDGFFTVPRNRFGCPDFDMANDVDVTRTVTVSVFPHEAIGLDVSHPTDQLSPSGDASDIRNLLELATEASSADALTSVYESGLADAERWCRQEDDRRKEQMLQERKVGVDAGSSR